ncbi:phospho-acceptor domain-containing protein [Paraburkholderia sp. BL21I4N1]|nr:phospho-acceptor domain-containing protein [Paraburkholderia sp. BL21I4N1]
MEFYTDTLHELRFDSAELMPGFLTLLKKNCEHKQIDNVIGLTDVAFDFTEHYHAKIWPGAPMIITRAAGSRPKDIPSGFAYMPVNFDIDGTLATAKPSQPSARRLVIVSGAAKLDRRFAKRATSGARARQFHDWTVDVRSELSVPEPQHRLSALGTDTAVLYTTTYRDNNGRTHLPYELVAPMAKSSGAPIYGEYPSYLGHEMAAESVIGFETTGHLAGTLAASILIGKTPARRAIAAASTSRCIADAGVLGKLGLPAAALSENCELINVPPSFWREYRVVMLSAVGVVLLQALTIAALLWQRRHRRIAEDEATLRLDELSRAARFASAGELSASIAHEVGQPLGAILSNADAAGMMLKSGPETGELHSILADIRRDALRANQVVQRLRILLQKHTTTLDPLDLNSAFDEGLALLGPECRQRQIVIEATMSTESAWVLGDRVQLQQVLINLAINALDAMESTFAPNRILSVSTRVSGKGYELAVADRGHGIPADAGQRVFNSLYTTKPHGMGLGLSIVRTIVTTHGGQVWAAVREGGGSTFTVWLPAVPEPAMSIVRPEISKVSETTAVGTQPETQGGHL